MKRYGRWVLLIAVLLVTGVTSLALGPYREPLHRLAYGVRPGVHLEDRLVEGLYPGELRPVVLEFALSAYQAPENATIDQRTGRIQPETHGVAVDIQATMERVLSAGWGATVHLQKVPTRPNWTAAELSRLTRPAGRFSTTIFGSWGRRYNVQLAAQKVGHVLLLPGDEFSFNQLVGPYTRQDGWQPAPIASAGRMIDGIGGGVCQVSTTLYNAVLRAGLALRERHPHSVLVPYVPVGCDAAVSSDKDLRFRNDKGFPVLIQTRMRGNRVEATVFFPE